MRASLWLIAVLALASASCGPNIDLKSSLQVQDVATGWADLGVVNGQNKIVPSITFTFKNAGKDAITTLQGNVIFRRVGEDEEWGAGFLRIELMHDVGLKDVPARKHQV